MMQSKAVSMTVCLPPESPCVMKFTVEDKRCYITHAFIRNDHHGTHLRSCTLPRLESCLHETNSARARAVALHATNLIALHATTTIVSQHHDM
jgi:hypothetical protein